MAVPYHIVSSEVVVVNEAEEILLIKDPVRGWEIPGGQVEKGEALQQAAIREVKEESGVEVELTHYCGVHQNLQRDICNHIFLGKPVGGSLLTSSESEDVGYFPLPKALDLITRDYIKIRILSSLDVEKHPFIMDFTD